jgi:AbiTii-like protein
MCAMSLLREIQAAVIQEDTEIGPILLKLRLLASRLGSAPLEEWVKHDQKATQAIRRFPTTALFTFHTPAHSPDRLARALTTRPFPLI